MNPFDVLSQLPGVRRGWPQDDGGIAIEYIDEHSRVRAGIIHPDGSYDLADFGVDTALPYLTPHAGLVSHRWHQRAVILDVDRVYAYVEPWQIKPIMQAHAMMERPAVALDLNIPRVLSHTDSMLILTRLPGINIHDFSVEAAPAWQQFANLWPQFVTVKVPVKNFFATDTASELQWWANRVPTLPKTLVAEAVSAVTRGTPDRAVLVHRNVHDKNLFFDGSRLGLLDINMLAYGEAAVDLGNLLAYSELRWHQGRINDEVRDVMCGVVQELAETLQVSPARLAAYQQVARLRLAGLYSFRPAAAAWLPAWMATFNNER
ncbi:MAG: phosphotransferase [Corynebacterium sp.]|nr:phosphotransferase [Corynebacterium sp.]